MKREEQEHIKQTEYALAMRYMANAKDYLKKAGRDGRLFKDSKCVSSASGIAYKGVLVALDAWLMLKGVELPRGNKRGETKGKSIKFYRENISRLNNKRLSQNLNVAYDNLHLYGYYDSTLVINTIDTGFEVAYEIIDLIKPSQGAV